MTIIIKDQAALEAMRIAGRQAAEVLEMIEEYIKPGVSTDTINQRCHEYIVDHLKGIPAPLNYKGFPKSVCTSVNHVICHGIPSGKILKKSDIINVDVTVIQGGYHGDTSKMFYVGEPSKLAKRLCETTQRCLYAAIELVRPGCHLGDIGATIQQIAHEQRFSVVREYCGHGIGRGFHEEPQVLHYGTAGTGVVCQPGMTFTIEPMINAGKRHTKLLPDQWTVVTKDHSLSAQYEHTLAVTETGCEILTLRQEEQGCVHPR